MTAINLNLAESLKAAFGPLVVNHKPAPQSYADRRKRYVLCLEAFIDEQMSDNADCETVDDDFYPSRDRIARGSMQVELEGEEARGFCIDKPTGFTGYAGAEQLAYDAFVTKWKRQGRKIVLWLDYQGA